MKSAHRLAALALALCVLGCGGTPRGAGQPADPPPTLEPVALPADFGERAMDHVRTLVGFGARHAGAPGWQRSVDYIAGQLESIGLSAQRDRWDEPAEGLTFENVSATIPGRVAGTIVIGAHHDTKITSGHPDPAHNFEFCGANDSASGVGLLLELARHLVAARPAATIELVFFDGEESVPFRWDLDRALFGSRRFVRLALADRDRVPIRAMVLLDMVGAEDLSIDDESRSDRRLHSIFAAAAKACGHERWFFANRMQITDDHVPFLDAGIPAIDLIDIADNPQWHTPDDTLEHLSPRSLRIVGEVVLTALPAVVERFVVDRPR